MNLLDELYERFHDNEDFSPATLARLYDQNRILLERVLAERQRSERLLEVLTDVVSGLVYSSRYEEAIPIAKACLSMYSQRQLSEMGENPSKDILSVRVALIFALFQTGRRSESLALANDYLRVAPQENSVRWVRDMNWILRAKHYGRWLWYASGALLLLSIVLRHTNAIGSIWPSALGMTVVLFAVLIEHWAKKREVALRAEVNKVFPSLRSV